MPHLSNELISTTLPCGYMSALSKHAYIVLLRTRKAFIAQSQHYLTNIQYGRSM